MSRFSHVTPRYIYNRIAQMSYEKLHPNAPWLTSAMIDFLDQWLRDNDSGVEWGSGRSTVWLARRVRNLMSVEDNQEWGQKVRTMLSEHDLDHRVKLSIVGIESGQRSADSPYVSIVSTISPKSLDFCLVDGDLRDHCALAALPLLKPGGLLIIDNIERYLPNSRKTNSPNARNQSDGFESRTWLELWRQISHWRSYWTTNGISDTAAWFKPSVD